MPKRGSKKHDFPLLGHVDGLMSRLRENLAAAVEKFDEDAIHDARVATRRMKAALELMTPVLSRKHAKPLGKGLRRIRRRLGSLRDADVMIRHLSDLTEDRRHGKAAGWLRDRLEESRQMLREESQEGASVEKELRRIVSWLDVRAEVLEAREAVDSLLAESLHKQADDFSRQADRLVAEFLWRPSGGRPELNRIGKRQNPHDVRIAGKALRYTLEMAETEGFSPGARVMSSFKKMQEFLGTWHDYVVLADCALKEMVASELMHHEAAACDPIIELARNAAKKSGQELSAFCRLWEQKGEAITRRIRSLFVLTERVDGPDETPDDKTTDAIGGHGPATVSQGSPGELTKNAEYEVEDLTRSQTDPDPAETGASEVPAIADSASRQDA